MADDENDSHESRMAALRKQADELETEISGKKKALKDKGDEEGSTLLKAYQERRKLLAELRDARDEMELADREDEPSKEKFDIEEAELRLDEIRQRMRHADERHRAWMDHVEKNARAPLSFVRREDGRIIGAK